MDILATAINALVVAAAAALVTFVSRSQHRDLAGRLDRHEDKNDSRFDRLEARTDRLEDKIDAVRTDITQLAFRLGDRPHPQTG